MIEQRADHVRVATVGEDGLPGPMLTLARATTGSVIRVELAGASSREQAAPLASETPVIVMNGDAAGLALDPAGGDFVLRSATQPEVLAPLTVRWLEAENGTIVAVELLGPLNPGEALVGFGERFDALDQRPDPGCCGL